jgi:hypothetical protein
VCERIKKLFAMMGSPNAAEAQTARDMLSKLLTEQGLSWNDLPAVLVAVETSTSNAPAPASEPTAGPNGAGMPNVLGLILVLIEEHVAVTPHECMAIALWVLHTYVFDRFSFTPRLALLSPVSECGKTTVLTLIQLLVNEGYRIDNVTPAAIYHQLEEKPDTVLLIDEGDNLELGRNGALRSVFNSGHKRGGCVMRYVAGSTRQFPTFAPLAVAAIGILPLPLLLRSVVVNIQRTDNQVKRLEESDPAFPVARGLIRKWATTCTLAREPEMPSALRNRATDNWRVLLSIADSLGYSSEARSSAVKLCADRPNEDVAVVLLADVRTVFQMTGRDRISSERLVELLCGLEDGRWTEWRGRHGDRAPRRLTQNELAGLLSPFGIHSRTIWPPRRRPDDKSSRGYLRSDFEAAWRRYWASFDRHRHQCQSGGRSFARHCQQAPAGPWNEVARLFGRGCSPFSRRRRHRASYRGRSAYRS